MEIKNLLAIKAKQDLINFVGLIDKKLDKYWQRELKTRFGYNKKQKDLVRKILKHAREHNLRSAKRIRAAFVYYSYLLGGRGIDEQIWKAAMGVELIHTALLIHDDFMDEDDLRRGQPTTHKYFEEGNRHHGEAMAVNVGDAVLGLGYELLLSCGFDLEKVVEATKLLMRGVVETTYGQAYDLELARLREWKEKDVIDLHKAKTAIYTYKNPLFVGAILAELPKEVFPILEDYSLKGGVAFQLQDDVLGVFGDEQKTGKSANSDLLQGKCTAMPLYVLEQGSEKEKEILKKVWGKKRAGLKEIAAAKNVIKTSGAYDRSVELAKKYAKEAVNAIERLRNFDLDSKAIDFIQGIALYMVEREV